jgi:hypothetical protein
MSSQKSTQLQQNKQDPICMGVISSPLYLNQRSEKAPDKSGAFHINTHNPNQETNLPVTHLE